MDSKMKQEFIQMLKEARGTPQEWEIIMEMVDLLEGDDDFERLAELHKGLTEYGGQYLSEREAIQICGNFINYDGSRGVRWQPSILFDAVENLGGKRAEQGRYNCWALYAVMNMMSSDYGGVISTIAQGDEYAKVCYMMAVAFFNDRDKRHNVREYFDV